MILTVLLFFSALSLSAVAAYYSIAGLVTLFPSAAIAITIMGGVLEFSKLVVASWLYRNWQQTNIIIRSYFVSSVAVLSFITSMGIFGFLSKAHVEQSATSSSFSIELSVINSDLESQKRRLSNAQKSLEELDRIVSQTEAEKASSVRSNQRRERLTLTSEITDASKNIRELNDKALPLRKEVNKVEAEVGPIKYIADMLYGGSDPVNIERAVRVVILLLVFVFDPLAITMLIAANSQLKTTIQQKKSTVITETVDAVEIDNKQFADIPRRKTKKSQEIPPEILEKVFKK